MADCGCGCSCEKMATGCWYGYERRCEAAAVILMLTVVGLFFLNGCSGSVDSGTGGGEPLVPSLILFGDSTVDVGNNNFVDTLARSDFLPYGRDFDTKTPTGRFTDGRMVADFLATSLGLPMSLAFLDPNATGDRILQGINFASAGSGYLSSTASLLNVIPAFQQLEMFKLYKTKVLNLVGPQRAGYILSEALYFVSTGSNDYILNYYVSPSLQKQYTTEQFNTMLLSRQCQFVQDLYQAGARKIGMLGYPSIGCIPAQITLFGEIGQQGCVEYMNDAARVYNKALQNTIPELLASMPGLRLLYLDAFSYLYDAFNNPSQYGFTQTRRACCGEGLISTAMFCNPDSLGTCSDASEYLFFDSLHPSQNAYKQIADSFYNDIVSFLAN